MIYLIAYRLVGGEQGLAINGNAFHGSENLEELKTLLPDYNRYHVVDNTWSASATIYWMQYRPCIIAVNSLDEIAEVLVDRKIQQSSSIAGRAIYTLLKPDYKMNIVYDSRLIDERVNTAKPFYEK